MPKKLCFFFDGTSNEIDSDAPTNVLLTASGTANFAYRRDENDAIVRDHDGVAVRDPQIIFYKKGVGTKVGDRAEIASDFDKVKHLLKEKVQGATGKGLYNNVLQAYEDLCFNYEPGDEIYVFGFSRGAYTARSFCGFIQHNGITSRVQIEKVLAADAAYRSHRNYGFSEEDIDARIDRLLANSIGVSCSALDQEALCKRTGQEPTEHPIVKVKFLGVWDTVKTLTAGDKDEDGHQFHIDDLVDIVETSRHAVASDEYREEFDVTVFRNIDQINKNCFEMDAKGCDTFEAYLDSPERAHREEWFPGGHGSVGGGGDIRGLSDASLIWIVEGAKRAGLKIDVNLDSKVFTARPDFTAPLDNTSKFSLFENIWAAKAKHLDEHVRSGPIRLSQINGSVIRRVAHSLLDTTDPNDIYNPGALKLVWSDILEEARGYSKADKELSFHVNPDVVPGEVRQIEGDRYYTYMVKSGDSLGRLSKEFYGSNKHVQAILNANKFDITSADNIQVGQVINIPVTEDFIDGTCGALNSA